METPPLAEEVVVGTSREEEEEEEGEGSSSPPSSLARFGGAQYNEKRGAAAPQLGQQPPRKIRMTTFEEGEDQEGERYADGMEVMDLRVGAMGNGHDKMGLTAKN